MLGQYMMVAVNDPKKYPKKPILSETVAGERNHMMAPEQHENLARAKYG